MEALSLFAQSLWLLALVLLGILAVSVLLALIGVTLRAIRDVSRRGGAR